MSCTAPPSTTRGKERPVPPQRRSGGRADPAMRQPAGHRAGARRSTAAVRPAQRIVGTRPRETVRPVNGHRPGTGSVDDGFGGLHLPPRTPRPATPQPSTNLCTGRDSRAAASAGTGSAAPASRSGPPWYATCGARPARDSSRDQPGPSASEHQRAYFRRGSVLSTTPDAPHAATVRRHRPRLRTDAPWITCRTRARHHRRPRGRENGCLGNGSTIGVNTRRSATWQASNPAAAGASTATVRHPHVHPRLRGPAGPAALAARSSPASRLRHARGRCHSDSLRPPLPSSIRRPNPAQQPAPPWHPTTGEVDCLRSAHETKYRTHVRESIGDATHCGRPR